MRLRLIRNSEREMQKIFKALARDWNLCGAAMAELETPQIESKPSLSVLTPRVAIVLEIFGFALISLTLGLNF